MIQMATATIAVVLLLRTGVSKWALLAAVSSCLCTTISVLLFGGRRSGNIPQDDAPARRPKTIR